jgi:bleomycin hydrolase
VVDIHERFALAVRGMTRRPSECAELRSRALRDVVRMLVAHLGTPPLTVRWRGKTLSPREYARAMGFHPAEWRVVISNPLLPFGRVYERQGSAIVSEARHFNLRRLNVTPSRLHQLVNASLRAGFAAGVSADVERNDIDHRRGIMHPAVFDRHRIYGARLIGDLPRRDDIYLGVASSKHAMTITGLDQESPDAPPVKYRVVNSWGSEVGDRGLYHMYAAWFEENVFKLAVHQRVLSTAERAAYRQPEPLGSDSFY